MTDCRMADQCNLVWIRIGFVPYFKGFPTLKSFKKKNYHKIINFDNTNNVLLLLSEEGFK